MKKIFEYWKNLFIEIKYWIIFLITINKNRKYILDYNEQLIKENKIDKNSVLMIDWIGRLGLVVNLPIPDSWNFLDDPHDKDFNIFNFYNDFNNVYPYINDKISYFNDLFGKLRLLDITDVYWEKWNEPGTFAYTVFIIPRYEHINLWKFIWNILKLFIPIFLIYKLVIFLNTEYDIIDKITNLLDKIF